MAALLSITGLSKHYGGIAANDDLSLEVQAGEIVGVIGPNGAGKTTLFNLITGFERPDRGEIRFDGQPIDALSPDARNRLGIARTFQILKPFARMTVEENVMVGALPRAESIASAREDARRCIELVGLAHKREAKARELSTGQRKRLEMARAMATRPRLLLLDEVTGGVDQPSIPALVELVGQLRAQGTTLMVIEHNMRVIMELADRILFLHLGAKLAEGRPREVASDPRVSALYLGTADA